MNRKRVEQILRTSKSWNSSNLGKYDRVVEDSRLLRQIHDDPSKSPLPRPQMGGDFAENGHNSVAEKGLLEYEGLK